MPPVNRLVEYTFFFGLLGVVAFIVWELIAPFIGALALAAIIVTICYPLYERVLHKVAGNNSSLAAFISTLLVIFVVVVPVTVLGAFLLREAVSIGSLFNNGNQISIEQTLTTLEGLVQQFIPDFTIDVTAYIQQAANFMASNIGAIFTGTASTAFSFFIALIASFYFFRDGRVFTKYLVKISPLPDDEDELILKRLARSIRSVALGTVLVALIQGLLTGFGLWLFGFERAVLWGSVAAVGALVPGVGTSIVFLPAVGYLAFTGQYLLAGGVALWGALAVGLIDNFLGPYLMSRGNSIHPFLVLISVLGGISLFGPIGFVLGPVTISLFMVLLELYGTHIAPQHPQPIADEM